MNTSARESTAENAGAESFILGVSKTTVGNGWREPAWSDPEPDRPRRPEAKLRRRFGLGSFCCPTRWKTVPRNRFRRRAIEYRPEPVKTVRSRLVFDSERIVPGLKTALSRSVPRLSHRTDRPRK